MKKNINKKWILPEPIPENVANELSHLSEYLRIFLFNRNITTAVEADRFLNAKGSIHDPFLLDDMKLAVERILRAIENKESIVVYGDYDADGITATALLVKAIRLFGGIASSYIPNRFDEGYGLNIEALKTIKQENTDLVITVDCGIRSANEVQQAMNNGLEIIISDHHTPKGDLPPALAVICPKKHQDIYPEKNLAGVGLAYKIAEALTLSLPDKKIDLSALLALVAIGTIADIVPLTGENRALVKAGLEEIRKGSLLPINSLAKITQLDINKINAKDIAFVIAPRLNAAGRIASAQNAYNLLVSKDLKEIGYLVQKLDDQNSKRKNMTKDIQEKAQFITQAEKPEMLIFAADEYFNMGVVGLAAAKLTDLFYLPSIIGAMGEEYTRASCRSIPEFHITKALDECEDLLEQHGGHAMAAGFTIKNEKLEQLADQLKAIAKREMGSLELIPTLKADLEIPLRLLHPSLLEIIAELEPTGMDNPSPLLVSKNVIVKRYRAIGSDKKHLKMTVKDPESNLTYEAIAFNQAYWAKEMPNIVDLIYYFEINEFNGKTTLQLNIQDIKPSTEVS